jgi:hypothetical protein
MLIIHFVFRFLYERSKTDRHGITEILLKVALNTITISGFFSKLTSWSLPVVDWICVAHIKCPVFVHVKYYLLLDLFNLPEQVGHFRLLTGFMLLILNVRTE